MVMDPESVPPINPHPPLPRLAFKGSLEGSVCSQLHYCQDGDQIHAGEKSLATQAERDEQQITRCG